MVNTDQLSTRDSVVREHLIWCQVMILNVLLVHNSESVLSSETRECPDYAWLPEYWVLYYDGVITGEVLLFLLLEQRLLWLLYASTLYSDQWPPSLIWRTVSWYCLRLPRCPTLTRVMPSLTASLYMIVSRSSLTPLVASSRTANLKKNISRWFLWKYLILIHEITSYLLCSPWLMVEKSDPC